MDLACCDNRARRASWLANLRHFDRDRYLLDAYVVMPNHVHALVEPIGQHSMADILRSWKSFTANAINRALDRRGTVWMR